MLSCAVQAVARRGAGWLAGETRGVVGSELNGGKAVWQSCASGRSGVRVQLASSGVCVRVKSSRCVDSNCMLVFLVISSVFVYILGYQYADVLVTF